MKTLPLLIATLIPLGASHFASAGEAVVQGTGRVSAKPDYVTVTINVSAECYGTPAEASSAADSLASSVFTFLKGRINTNEGAQDDLISNGGYTQPYERYTTDENGRSKRECKDTFQKQNAITLKSSNIEGFSKLFDEIQSMVYGQFAAKGDGQSTVYATINQPTTHLFHATKDAAEKLARAKAVQNAVEQFEAMFIEQCAVTSYQITGLGEPEAGVRPMPYESRALAAAGGDTGAPIQFDLEWINAGVTVKFSFEGGRCTNLLN
jgi:uncharacterized protein YggE